MPDALELPGVRRAVVPLVRAGDAVVDELVADRLPRLAAVVGALDQLPEPAAGLRRIQPIRVDGRALEVVDLPAAKVGAADVPLFALAVRCQDERALACADQYSYSALSLLFSLSFPPLRGGFFTTTTIHARPSSLHPRRGRVPLYCRSGRLEIDILAEKICRRVLLKVICQACGSTAFGLEGGRALSSTILEQLLQE